MAEWGFLTNHARVLLHIARGPGARLRDIAASLGITERRAHGIITDLAEAGRTGGRLAPDRRRQRRCTAWAASAMLCRPDTRLDWLPCTVAGRWTW